MQQLDICNVRQFEEEKRRYENVRMNNRIEQQKIRNILVAARLKCMESNNDLLLNYYMNTVYFHGMVNGDASCFIGKRILKSEKSTQKTR